MTPERFAEICAYAETASGANTGMLRELIADAAEQEEDLVAMRAEIARLTRERDEANAVIDSWEALVDFEREVTKQAESERDALAAELARVTGERDGFAEEVKLFRDEAFFIILNANDVWEWALACPFHLEIDDWPKYLEAARRFGSEGKFAFMSVYESRGKEDVHPQESWFSDSDYAKRYNPSFALDRCKYDEAREWVKLNYPPEEYSESYTLTKESEDSELRCVKLKHDLAAANQALADAREAKK